jgi:hypothetical protein
MIAEVAGNLTYHIDTPIPRDGDDGVERTEIDTDDTHVGRKVRGTSRSGYCVNKSIG